MEKQTKRPYLFLGSFVVFSILHNFTFALTGFEEPVFFFLALLSIVGFVISVFYNIFTYFTSGKPHDLWKLGFLGLFGLFGLIGRFGPGFYGFYGFFAFFGLKK